MDAAIIFMTLLRIYSMIVDPVYIDLVISIEFLVLLYMAESIQKDKSSTHAIVYVYVAMKVCMNVVLLSMNLHLRLLESVINTIVFFYVIAL